MVNHRGPCPKCGRNVAFKKDGSAYGHRCKRVHEWHCHVAWKAGRKCAHGNKQEGGK
jgi:hypothetical protein